MPALPIDLITLYRKPSELREWVTCYKGRIDGSEPYVAAHEDIVTALLARFFVEHGDRIVASDQIDGVVVVPSRDRPGSHPLHTIVAGLGLRVPVVELLARGPGALGHRKPAPDGYTVVEQRKSMRLFLIDDVYSTGAMLNSAAAALASGGHEVAGAMAIARRINPDYDPAATALWEQQTAIAFDWGSGPVLNIPVQ